MRRLAAALISCAILLTAMPARACDPSWDWCGSDAWYDPYWDPPAHEEPSWSWSWWDAPIYEPAPVFAYEPAPIYEPAPVHEPVYEPAPIYVPPSASEPVAPQPTYLAAAEPAPAPSQPAPAWSDPVVWTSPGSDMLDATMVAAPVALPVALPVASIAVASTPDPGLVAAEKGLHLVTDPWAGNVVTTQGATTTYSSLTTSEDAGTAAKRVATVGTGETSPYDALVFNGRMSLSDGRSVKGDVYANYVWDGNDWVFDKYVFFQDDLEIARLAQAPIPPPPPAPAQASIPLPPPAPAQPPTATPPPSIAPISVPVPVTNVIPAPAYVAPIAGDVPPAPGQAAPPSTASQPRPRVVRAGIALAPQADPLGRFEVLRGRRIALWVRATVDDVPARVTSWRLVSGDLTALGPISGTGDEPLVATWRSVTATGEPFSVRIRATVEVAGEGPREVDATIDVIVRSPALVE